MSRCIAIACAVMITFVALTSACFAQPGDWIRFTLEQRRNDNRIQASFRDRSGAADKTNWSTGLMPSDLIGMEVSSFRNPGTRPLHFAVAREAGRLDCSGSGGSNRASGNCRFSANPQFTQLLASRGIGRPTRNQAFSLMAVNVRRELINALSAARYPTPTIDDLIALSALGVDGRYISDMARGGYRPASAHKLVEFKALGITPQWIAGFARVGYANVPGDGLVQLRALGVTPDYIAGFQRIGYRNLPVHTLVELKALNITPEFVRSAVRAGQPIPPVKDLVEMKVSGRKR